MTEFIISIITISLNSEDLIEETINSVIKQSYNHKNYIIIDGVSNDSTVRIIENYSSHLDYWISEPDKGISDAMNKGLIAATGDYILFLHSDDYLVDKLALENAAQYLDQEHDIFIFDLYYSDNGTKTLAKPRGFGWWMNFKTGILHQSVLCSKALFDKIGNFDTGLKIAMDYDFFLRAYRAGAKIKQIDIPLAVMRRTGISSRTDWQSLKARFSEERRIHLKNCNNLLLKILYLLYWPLYFLYRSIMSYKSGR